MALNYERIPEELRWLPRWCVAGLDEVTGKYRVPCVPTSKGLRKVDPTKSAQWSDFETCREYAEANPPHRIGFILTAIDGYTCIDLDIKNITSDPNTPEKWTTQEEIDRFQKIIMAFHSYTEHSAGGLGYHIWLKGQIGTGCRRGGTEVYSQERFIVCTGDVVIDTPIIANDHMLNMLVSEVRRSEVQAVELVEYEQVENDDIIFARATRADNADKFITLCEGKWDELGYPSQSEADQALLTMFAFYTKSNSQCMRLFRMTNLGKRTKAVKNDAYLLRTLRKIRGIEAKENITTTIGENMALALVQRYQQPAQAGTANPLHAAQAAPVVPVQQLAPQTPQNAVKKGNIENLLGEIFKAEAEKLAANYPGALPPMQPKGGLDWPPGLAGQIAQYIFDTSPRPVKEVSIVGALGFLAGFCGKTFNIPQSGLNLYIVLVARSAIGKEAMHTGISNIISRVMGVCSGAAKYIDFSDYASGPALTKAVAANPCFVNVAGEFGKKLQRMSNEDRSDGPMQQLRTVMTNLYQKSGPTSVFGGLGYSDKEKNIASISGVAYSMIGETTPDTLYDSLTDSMMADGFLSRFTIVEYVGERPAMNRNFSQPLSDQLFNSICDLIVRVEQLTHNKQNVNVTCTAEATTMLEHFDKHCDREINKTNNEGWRQMWNRAHLKVYRIAALLACADNPTIPVIDIEHTTWAYDLIMRDITIMIRRIDSGDIGQGDSTRENKLLDLCKTYFMAPSADSYAIPDELRKAGIIPRKYLQICTQRTSCFINHKMGQIASMDMTIRSLVDGGYFVEVSKHELVQKYNFHGKCFRVVHLPMNLEESAQVQLNTQINPK